MTEPKVPFTSALSNAAGSVAASISGAVSATTNAWTSLPPQDKIGIIVGVTAVATAATLGAFGPEAAAIDIGTISAEAGSLGMGAAGVAASAVGLPVIMAGTEDTGPELSSLAAAAAAERLDSPSWTKGMSKTAIGRAGDSMVANVLADAGKNFEYQVSYKMPSGETFRSDFTIGRTPASNGVGVETKTSSFRANRETWIQLHHYQHVYGHNYGYVFTDIEPSKVSGRFLRAIRNGGGFYSFW